STIPMKIGEADIRKQPTQSLHAGFRIHWHFFCFHAGFLSGEMYEMASSAGATLPEPVGEFGSLKMRRCKIRKLCLGGLRQASLGGRDGFGCVSGRWLLKPPRHLLVRWCRPL